MSVMTLVRTAFLEYLKGLVRDEEYTGTPLFTVEDV